MCLDAENISYNKNWSISVKDKLDEHILLINSLQEADLNIANVLSEVMKNHEEKQKVFFLEWLMHQNKELIERVEKLEKKLKDYEESDSHG